MKLSAHANLTRPSLAPLSVSPAQVFYDADCPFCLGLLTRFGGIFHRAGLVFRPLQSARGPFSHEEFMREMKLLRADGRWFGGAEAWAEMLTAVWWLRPIGLALGWPGVRTVARQVYGRVAANRHCLGGNCRLTPRRPLDRFLLLILFPAAAFLLRPWLAPWLFMWVLALALYAGCKWLTFRDSLGADDRPKGLGALIYLLLWPGMKASTWQRRAEEPPESWVSPAGRTLLGFTLLAGAIHWFPTMPPLARGWMGMLGIILMLHFGLFHLLSIFWRVAGFNAPPIMLSPLRARTLAEFWGQRWNRAFHDLAVNYLFIPLRRLFGARTGVMFAFVASGLIHELVITVPAGGGYGGPSVYFILQGLGMLLERSRTGRALGMGCGRRGKIWTVLIAALPVPLLFPAVFVERIILPMLQALGTS